MQYYRMLVKKVLTKYHALPYDRNSTRIHIPKMDIRSTRYRLSEVQVMIPIIKEAIKDLREGRNIDAYIAILLSITIAFLGLFGIVASEIVNAVLLACLGWLISNSLHQQKENSKRLDEVFQNINHVRSSSNAKAFFTENYVNNSQAFQDAFSTACELYVAGYAQNRMVVSYASQISRICSESGIVKFVVMDPSSSLIEVANKRSATPSRVSDVRHQHQAALARLSSIREQYFKGGVFEVKLIDIIVPYTIIGFDWKYPEKARVYIWLTPFKEPSKSRPGFVVTQRDDPEWFSFFRSQFEKMWDWQETKVYQMN